MTAGRAPPGALRAPLNVRAGLAAVVAATVVVKSVAMVKELSIASVFGTSGAVDALLVALVLPSFFLNVAGGSIDAAFTPVYIECRDEEGSDASARLFRSTNAAVLLLAVLTALSLGLIGPFALDILGSGFGAEKRALTVRLMLILLPAVVLGSLAGLWTAAVNAEERFGWAATAPIAVPLLTLVAVLVWGPTAGIVAAAWGIAGGYAVQCAFLGPSLRSCGLPVTPSWSGHPPALRRVGREFLPKAAGATLTVGTVVVDVSMAATLQEGSVAFLSYGVRVVAVVTAVGATALSTVSLPLFSRMVVARDRTSLASSTRSLSGRSALAVVPIVVIVFLFSEPIIRLLYERGAFTSADTAAVARVQAMYVLQLPFYFAAIIFVRLISALQANRLLALGAVINLVVNVTLNLLFMPWIGVAGIALSTSVAYAVSFIYLLVAARTTVRKRDLLTES